MNSLGALPSDLILEIFKWLPCPVTLRAAATCKRWRDLLYGRWQPRIGDWYRKSFPLTYPFQLKTQKLGWERMMGSPLITQLMLSSLKRDAQETVLKVLDKFPCLEVVIGQYDYYSPWQNKAKSPLALINWAGCPSMRVALFSSNDKHTPFCKMPLKYGTAQIFVQMTANFNAQYEGVVSNTGEICQYMFAVGLSANAHIFPNHLLSIAIISGRFDLAMSLLKAGADPLSPWDPPLAHMLANYPNYGLLAAIIAACPRQALKEFHAKTPNMFSHLFEKHRPLPKTPAMADLMRALDLLVDCFSFTAAGVPNGNPLHKVAAQMLKAEVVKEIAEKYKLSLLHRDDKGNTLLHAAVASQRDDIQKFCEWGIDVNAQNSDGLTAMHIACDGGYMAHVEPLLACGASLGILSKNGKYPINLLFNKTWAPSPQSGRLAVGRYSPIPEVERLLREMLTKYVQYTNSTNIYTWQLEALLCAPVNINTIRADPSPAILQKKTSTPHYPTFLFKSAQLAHDDALTVLLIRAGADPMVKDMNNRTALQAAYGNSNPLLIRHAHNKEDYMAMKNSSARSPIFSPSGYCAFCGSCSEETAHTRKHIKALKSGAIPFRPFCAHPVQPTLFVEQYGNAHAAPINAAYEAMVDIENKLLLNNAKVLSKPTPECCKQAGLLFQQLAEARQRLIAAASNCARAVWPSQKKAKREARKAAAAATAKPAAASPIPAPATVPVATPAPNAAKPAALPATPTPAVVPAPTNVAAKPAAPTPTPAPAPTVVKPEATTPTPLPAAAIASPVVSTPAPTPAPAPKSAATPAALFAPLPVVASVATPTASFAAPAVLAPTPLTSVPASAPVSVPPTPIPTAATTPAAAFAPRIVGQPPPFLPADAEAACREVKLVWPWEGSRVQIAGSFNKWQRVGMVRDPKTNQHVFTVRLPRGAHQFKFIVDDVWKYDGEQLMCRDPMGNINNFTIIL